MGEGVSPRPSSSITTPTSAAPPPAPPYRSGMASPDTPTSRHSRTHPSSSAEASSPRTVAQILLLRVGHAPEAFMPRASSPAR
jgi:hypothetical protein